PRISALSGRLFLSTATAPTAIYTLSLHDALPILRPGGTIAASRAASPGGDQADQDGEHRADGEQQGRGAEQAAQQGPHRHGARSDRKSTRLNSSHVKISYAVFCLKKKKKSNHYGR